MITKCVNQSYQFLGAQILYQKLEKEISGLQKKEIHALKEFLFFQLAGTSLNIPTIRKISASASLIAVIIFLEEWPHLIDDIIKFMRGSNSQLQNGLILLSNIA
jgi:hypothetical protein